jgi:hypothetical protein
MTLGVKLEKVLAGIMCRTSLDMTEVPTHYRPEPNTPFTSHCGMLAQVSKQEPLLNVAVVCSLFFLFIYLTSSYEVKQKKAARYK